jgi:hypothetical protein
MRTICIITKASHGNKFERFARNGGVNGFLHTVTMFDLPRE